MNQQNDDLSLSVVICFTFILTCFGWGELKGQDFSAEGTVSYQSHIPDGAGDLPPADTRTFTIVVNQDEWLLRVEGGYDSVNYIEIGHDGESLFVYRKRSQDSIRRRLNASISIPTGSGQIIPGSVPGHDENYSYYVWLGLASHRYFMEISPEGSIIPPWLTTDTPREEVPGDINLSKRSELFLPDELTYWDPDSSGSRLSVPWMRGRFKRVDETEINGMVLPSKWEFVEFNLKEGAEDATDVEIRSVVTVSVNAFREIEDNFSPLPEFAPPMLVSDYRYRASDPPAGRLGYWVRDENWPSVDDLLPQREYLRFALRMRHNEAGIDTYGSLMRIWLIGAFAIALAIPAITWYYFGRNQ